VLVSWLVLGLVLALAACSGSGDGAGQTSTTASPSNVPAVVTPPEARRPRSGGGLAGSFTTNLHSALSSGVPVAQGSFADPFFLVTPTAIYAYATNVSDAHIPVARSDTASTSVDLGDAMPTLASWTKPGGVWGPSVYVRDDGTYVMYYATTYGETGHQCVSHAVASNPAGPFVDESTAPFVCPLDLGGAIDPSMATIDGQHWLLYKSDGNCCGLPTSIWSLPLSDDLLSVQGTATELVTNDQPWEGDVVEAPDMEDIGGTRFLFYSGNDWNTDRYAVGYAVCESVTGPCRKPQSTPLVQSGGDVAGPGGETFVVDPRSDRVVMGFHGWLPGQVGGADGRRRLYLGEVTAHDGTLRFDPYR